MKCPCIFNLLNKKDLVVIKYCVFESDSTKTHDIYYTYPYYYLPPVIIVNLHTLVNTSAEELAPHKENWALKRTLCLPCW